MVIFSVTGREDLRVEIKLQGSELQMAATRPGRSSFSSGKSVVPPTFPSVDIQLRDKQTVKGLKDGTDYMLRMRILTTGI